MDLNNSVQDLPREWRKMGIFRFNTSGGKTIGACYIYSLLLILEMLRGPLVHL